MTFMYGIKLPRKRKKAFLAHFAQKNKSELSGSDYAMQCYLAQGIICEILWEENKISKNRSFYDYSIKGPKAYVSKKF
jgi:hypothetical protein